MEKSAGFKIQVSADVLRAACRFAGKNDIRYYLNGVCVEVYPRVAYIVATDGHTMALARLEPAAGEVFEGTGSAIIPREFCEKIKAPNCLDLVLEVGAQEEENGTAEFTINNVGVKTSGKTCDGKFPEWRRVIPSKTSGEAANFNPDYLKRCADAAKDLGSRDGYFGFYYNGNNSALANIREDFMAVLMPMRKNDSMAGETPEWAHENPLDVGRVLDRDEAHGQALKEHGRRESEAQATAAGEPIAA